MRREPEPGDPAEPAPEGLALSEVVEVCPMCCSRELATAFPPHVLRCRVCGSMFMSPRPSQDAIRRHYDRGTTYEAWQGDGVARAEMWSRRLRRASALRAVGTAAGRRHGRRTLAVHCPAGRLRRGGDGDLVGGRRGRSIAGGQSAYRTGRATSTCPIRHTTSSRSGTSSSTCPSRSPPCNCSTVSFAAGASSWWRCPMSRSASCELRCAGRQRRPSATAPSSARRRSTSASSFRTR